MKLNIPLRQLHRSFNNALTIIALLLSMYILAAPFVPSASLAVERRVNTATAEEVIKETKVSTENTLIIPRIFLEEQINEGQSENTLENGAWRIPFTSTPDAGSNTVIAGHRFYYTKSAVFYHLDKLVQGDSIIVDWVGKRYTYIVTSTQIVTPDRISIQDPTPVPTLTLYTCTPMWSSQYRLVITAELREKIYE